ncbi:MAG TPA: DUF1501 domain-containing protein [Gemmataceae bacterium]|jgi:hypothetical protein|nr:DUF1501 domain-containing protein [Gemmataceae bacterium]
MQDMQDQDAVGRTQRNEIAIGLLGLGIDHVAGLRGLAQPATTSSRRACIYIFLSGGLAQQDSFDLKPEAAAEYRGEFKPIATSSPGIQICEHLPRLAQRSRLWALVRSLTHSSNDHSSGHHIMMTGRSDLPPGFSPNQPRPGDWPSIAAVAGALTGPRNNLPPAVVLPERLIHTTGRIIPGQFAGIMGPQHDPWFIEASAYEPRAYGAYPQFEFDHQDRPYKPSRLGFQTPSLSLPEDLGHGRLGGRMHLLQQIDRQRRELDRVASTANLDAFRQAAIALLTDRHVRDAFDVQRAPDKVQERYGRNAFGWSLLMARRLIEAGFNLVQVNLGNNETWDTHGNAFPHLKDKLFPPTDQALSALLDDLSESGQLDSTLIVMAGEFGRTPKISTLPQFYKLPGRDHWGAVQTVLFAGGGVKGGTIVGSSDRIAGYPKTEPQTPENLAATIYHALGVPQTAHWRDSEERPHYVYQGEPIKGLL